MGKLAPFPLPPLATSGSSPMKFFLPYARAGVVCLLSLPGRRLHVRLLPRPFLLGLPPSRAPFLRSLSFLWSRKRTTCRFSLAALLFARLFFSPPSGRHPFPSPRFPLLLFQEIAETTLFSHGALLFSFFSFGEFIFPHPLDM